MKRVLSISAFTICIFSYAVPGFAQLSPRDQALFSAVYNHNAQGVEDALKQGANIEAGSSDPFYPTETQTPLDVAAAARAVDVVKVLLDHHANIEAKGDMGLTPLASAASDGSVDIVKLLLEDHASVDATGDGGSTLLAAAAYGGVEVVKLLLENHANVEAKDNSGCTPLIRAAYHSKADVIRLLLDNHANPDARCYPDKEYPDGRTVLDMAVAGGNADAVHLLLASYTPATAIPETARRPFVQANTLYKTAQSDDGVKAALVLYEQALEQAPWYTDAWCNQSLAQEKIGDYRGALGSMIAVQQLEPNGATDRATLDRIYALEARAK